MFVEVIMIIKSGTLYFVGQCRYVLTVRACYTVQRILCDDSCADAPCGLRGCKNGPAPFPGRMSYKATKPGLVSVLYLIMFFYCVVVY